MTADEYWEGSPFLTIAYADAHRRKFEERNREMWLQGLYVYNAFSAVMNTFGWGLGGCKGQRPEPYVDHPIAFTEHEKKLEHIENVKRTREWFMAGQKE